MGPLIVVGAAVPADLAIARQVRSIFVVDDLEGAFRQLAPRTEVLVPPELVPSGGRFVVRHRGGHAIESLDLRNVPPAS